ncbi:hypothetical protein [Nocardioides sp.]|uniref:hypothetical protein n=1 Tax=Nocardioides sp. TaxID=35761 RepID=UPI002F3E8554
MPEIVMRVRFVGGEHSDVVYTDPDADSIDAAVDHVIAVLSDGEGVLRCQHGDRLIVLFARGIAAFEVAPRGAIL